MKTETYTQQTKRLPQTGRQIIGRIENNNIIVYQAFNPSIARYAVANQQFGGNAYSFNRMSWIKPGFLWMMYRAGWATKENQERVLAISLPLEKFYLILEQATKSTYDETMFGTPQQWQQRLAETEVRLQWDPDHDPLGNKLDRRAIQLGMKGDILRKFCTEWITKVEDITPFVKEQYERMQSKRLNELVVPYEELINMDDERIALGIGLTKTMVL